MKIYFATSFFGGFHGGGYISVKLLAEALEKRKHEVRILTTKKTEDSNIISLSYTAHIPEKLLKLGCGMIDNLLAYSLKEVLHRSRPDLLHIQDVFILPATLYIARKLDIPIVATIRDNARLHPSVAEKYPLGIPWLIRRRLRIIVECYRNIDTIISVSDYIGRDLVEVGVPRDKITTIYDLPPSWNFEEAYRGASRKITLFALGRICKYKGFEVLAKAMALACRKCVNLELVIAGEGPYLERLKRLVKRLGISGHVRFIGVVPYEEIKKLYFKSDIVVFPSIYPEPLGRVSIEAMVAGKPVIASRVGGIPEIVENGVTGILVPPSNPEALAKAIISLVEDEKLRKKMGRRGRELIFKKLNPNAIIKQHLRVYRNICNTERFKDV